MRCHTIRDNRSGLTTGHCAAKGNPLIGTKWLTGAVCWLAWAGLCLEQQSVVQAQQASGATLLRVLSYNIHHGEGVDGKLDLDRIARTIQSVEPDLVALQEVDRKVTRTGGIDQPAELARLTKMQVAFGGNIVLQGGDYGNAVLSRWPIRRHENHKLPRFDNGEQRSVGTGDQAARRPAAAVAVGYASGPSAEGHRAASLCKGYCGHGFATRRSAGPVGR